MGSEKPFTLSRDDRTLILALEGKVGSLNAADLLSEVDVLLDEVNWDGIDGVVVDFADVDYFGSEVLEAILRVWNRVHPAGGRLAVCNLSDVGRDILSLSRFDTLWQVADSREAAVQIAKGA